MIKNILGLTRLNSVKQGWWVVKARLAFSFACLKHFRLFTAFIFSTQAKEKESEAREGGDRETSFTSYQVFVLSRKGAEKKRK